MRDALLLALAGGAVAAVLGILVNWVAKPQWAHEHPGRVVALIVVLVVAGAFIAVSTQAALSPLPSAHTTEKPHRG
jgi:hypothetical protein